MLVKVNSDRRSCHFFPFFFFYVGYMKSQISVWSYLCAIEIKMKRTHIHFLCVFVFTSEIKFSIVKSPLLWKTYGCKHHFIVEESTVLRLRWFLYLMVAWLTCRTLLPLTSQSLYYGRFGEDLWLSEISFGKVEQIPKHKVLQNSQVFLSVKNRFTVVSIKGSQKYILLIICTFN